MRSRCRHSPGSTAVRPSSDRPASAGRPAFCNIARSVCIGSTVAVTSPQTIAEISVVDHHPAVPTNRLASAARHRNAARSVCIGSTMAVTSSERSQRYPSSTSTSTQPSRQTGWRRPPAYRNVARSVCICSTVAVTPPQTITAISFADARPGHWPLERGQRGAARGLDDDPVLVEETQRGGHRLGIGHDNRMNLVSRSPFDRRVARPLRAERRRDARDCRQFDPMPLRERARIAVGAFRFGRDHRHVVPAVARQPFEHATHSPPPPTASTIASGFGPAAAISSIIVAWPCHSTRSSNGCTNASCSPSADCANAFASAQLAPCTTKPAPSTRISSRARADALSGTTTSTGTPSSRPQYATAMPALPPDDDTKRRAPAACRASQTAPMPRSLNEARRLQRIELQPDGPAEPAGCDWRAKIRGRDMKRHGAGPMETEETGNARRATASGNDGHRTARLPCFPIPSNGVCYARQVYQ